MVLFCADAVRLFLNVLFLSYKGQKHHCHERVCQPLIRFILYCPAFYLLGIKRRTTDKSFFEFKVLDYANNNLYVFYM